MKNIITTTIIFLFASIATQAQDYFETAPYTSPVRSTCGAANNCALRTSEDHEYQITIPTTGNWTFSLCGSSYDTYLYVGTTLCSSNVGLNDDFCGLQSEITANIAAGTYYVTVEGFSGCGSYTLNVTGPPPPASAEDDCSGALDINCGDVVTGNTSGYTVDVAPFCGTSDGTGGGLWYKTTATCTSITASLCGSGFDTKLRIFEGTCGSLVCVGGIDDFCGVQSEITWAATTGTTYYILVHGYGSATGAYSLSLTCTGCCATNPPTTDFSAPTTVCEGTSATFSDISTCNPTTWSWSFPGGVPATSTAQNPTISYGAAGTYDVTLTTTNAFGTDTEVKTGYITVINCGGSCVGNYYYVRSNTGSPWGSTANETAMDAVFGAGIWTQEYFQTANPATLFSAATCTIFMDGSDGGATEFETFLNANITAVENWVATGGRLFLNTAPNEDNGLSFGFGGTTMNYPSGLTATGNAVVPAHAIFSGPFLPIGASWTGNWFAHGNITNAGTSLITDSGTGLVVCSEKFYGAGLVVFGTMTTSNWHTPAPEGQNLRQNILCYISPPIVCGTPLPIELLSFTGETVDDVNILEWVTASEVNNDYFTVERSIDGKQFYELIQVDGAGTSLQINNYSAIDNDRFEGVTYYRLKQTDIDGEFKYSEVIALDNRQQADISVFPSPADDFITVTLVKKPSKAMTVIIRNAVGKEVFVTEFNKKVETIDVSSLPSGMYFISMIIDGESTMRKFTVK